MLPTDRTEFSDRLTGCMEAVYDKQVTPAMLEVWFSALATYPMDEIRAAFTRHVTDPDRGQFAPKPADIIRAIDGGSDGRALAAWTKVDQAIRCVGGWQSVCFDDPRIHACISAMGGWIKLCETSTDELPFRQQEFARRYRAMALTPLTDYPPHLIGRAETGNAMEGYPVEPPLLLGDANKAAQVLLGGKEHARLSAPDKAPQLLHAMAAKEAA